MSNPDPNAQDVEIVDEILVCPYCMNQVSFEDLGCCGESSAHFEDAYLLSNDELVLKSEFKGEEK